MKIVQYAGYAFVIVCGIILLYEMIKLFYCYNTPRHKRENKNGKSKA